VRIARDIRAAVSEAGLLLLNQPVALGCEPIAGTAWTAPAEVDDRTVDYLRSVRRGVEALDAVLASMSKPQEIDVRQTLALLREAGDHLSSADCALPGFEIVALGEGCACRAAPRR
jgi:hypothetical protein